MREFYDVHNFILACFGYQLEQWLHFRYRVDQKKVSSKSEEKIYSIMKMTSQRAENLVHVQQHRGKYFYKKNIFLILFYIANMTI